MYSDTVTRFITQGAKLYSSKDYEQAATSYADACAAFNEEHSRDDPDLLLLYGKALFQNGVAKSGVLGGVSTVSRSEDQSSGLAENQDDEDESGFQFHEGTAEGDMDDEEEDHVPLAEEDGDSDTETAGEAGNADNSDDEEGAPEEEQSDFEAAWDILDLTRALLEKVVEDSAQNAADLQPPYLVSDDAEPSNKYVETIKKLSETYDLLGEVSLETENFLQAATDLEACLELRKKLYSGTTSSWISESHYKLSLALEFCIEDPDLRSKAAGHVRLAIAVVKAQAENQPDLDDTKKTENAGLLRDLEERHKELQKDPEKEVEAEQLDIIKGLLGEAVAGSGAARAFTETAEKPTVNDLSSMVKKRKAKPVSDAAKKPKKE
ncbi:hypothetical protein METBIDRAFT_79094 [Metschnikowia bicuspidata var. bicuspidata NRRL YB-4993]|uniref:Tetratricopeptide SHNi-TPR domain-containing protein n=1 Tax=Metschnikowia bicuspidata var. bicuspidata NRRL YB-4993 TaxID=869754 RepID=A0A1A0H6K1_9ASCO|nr:hypothetical protein METBIDRAFT_79094 [Metschnikowia bicuspidata var. bicuspidata NRRL YB-4993]OBA19714.1 hypothetical protein METBIDRAFT_79094 [Metschnikowia bicuspidata var. bicuspidata NRRL YB-4993]